MDFGCESMTAGAAMDSCLSDAISSRWICHGCVELFVDSGWRAITLSAGDGQQRPAQPPRHLIQEHGVLGIERTDDPQADEQDDGKDYQIEREEQPLLDDWLRDGGDPAHRRHQRRNERYRLEED